MSGTYVGYVAENGADLPVVDYNGEYLLGGGTALTPTTVTPAAFSITTATLPPPTNDYVSANFNGYGQFSGDSNGSLSGYSGTGPQGTYQLVSPTASASVGENVALLETIPGLGTFEGPAVYEGYVAAHGLDLPVLAIEGLYFVLGGDGTTTHSSLSAYSGLTPACYVRGTLIATEAGEAPVETLAIGDGVVTASGLVRHIKWIGRRSYAGRFLAANPAVHPIRFRAGCLGAGLPRRDLLVSPEHAMVIDGLLIPARCLVNGRSIVKEPATARVDYVHVELDSHDVLLAEGAPSESFLDDDSRGLFHNAAEFGARYPGPQPNGRFCAPRVDRGETLEAIRKRLVALTVSHGLAA